MITEHMQEQLNEMASNIKSMQMEESTRFELVTNIVGMLLAYFVDKDVVHRFMVDCGVIYDD